MAAINKNTKCFVGLPGEQFVYETTNFPQSPQVFKTFYGDAGGASELPKDKVFLIGDYLGTALGEIIVDAGIEYQLIETVITTRTKGGIFGLGAGDYIEGKAPVYVKSSIISIDEVWANEQKYQRENKDKISATKALEDKNKLLNKIAEGSDPQTANLNNSGSSFNLTSIVLIVFTFIGLIIGGVFWWKGKQNKQQAKQSANGVI